MCLSSRQGKQEIRVRLPAPAFTRRIQVRCASVCEPHGAAEACRTGVREAPLVEAFASLLLSRDCRKP